MAAMPALSAGEAESVTASEGAVPGATAFVGEAPLSAESPADWSRGGSFRTGAPAGGHWSRTGTGPDARK